MSVTTVGNALIDLGGSLGNALIDVLQTPQIAVDRQPCVGGSCHLDPVSSDLPPKVKNRTQKGAVAPLAAVCF